MVGVEVVAGVAGEGEAFVRFDCAGDATDGVEGVVDEGVACGGEVDADLVGAACDDVDVDEGLIGCGVSVEGFAVGLGGFAIGCGSKEGVDFEVGNAANGMVDFEGVGEVGALNEGAVDFGEFSFSEVFAHL